MQVDKEFLAKRHFWIITVVVVPLLFSAMFWVSWGVAGAIEEKKKKIDLEAKEMQKPTYTTPRSHKELEILTGREKRLQSRKAHVWNGAWKIQNKVGDTPQDFMTWPPTLQKLNPLHFGDPIPTSLCELYARPDAYQAEVSELERLIRPVRYTNGVARVLNYVPRWRVPLPTSEEVWLAQEDYWVQRELLLAVNEANDIVRNYVKVDGAGAADQAKGEIARQRFVNPNWQIDLVLARNAAKEPTISGTITNIGRARRPLNRVVFQAGLRGDSPTSLEDLIVEGDPVGVGQTAVLRFVDADKSQKPVKVLKVFNPDGLHRLVQVLEWGTAPVRNVERIELAHHSHRTSHRSLQPPLFIRKVQEEKRAILKDAVQDNLQAAQGGPGGGPAGPSAGPSKPAVLLDSALGDRTPNGLNRRRYIDVSPQVRRMPFGIVLIVDQAHVQDVLRALTNSRLRIQPTQVHMIHRRDQVQKKSSAGTTPTSRPGAEMDMEGEFFRPKDKDGERRMEKAGKGKGVPATPVDEALEEAPTNLVELAYYGIASLYEKYPPRGTTETESAGGS